jgi:hypothetical protein
MHDMIKRSTVRAVLRSYYHSECEPSQSDSERTVGGGGEGELRIAEVLQKLEQENGAGKPVHQQDKVSRTDPDSTYLTKGNRAAELGYFDNYLIDNESCVSWGYKRRLHV